MSKYLDYDGLAYFKDKLDASGFYVGYYDLGEKPAAGIKFVASQITWVTNPPEYDTSTGVVFINYVISGSYVPYITYGTLTYEGYLYYTITSANELGPAVAGNYFSTNSSYDDLSTITIGGTTYNIPDTLYVGYYQDALIEGTVVITSAITWLTDPPEDKTSNAIVYCAGNYYQYFTFGTISSSTGNLCYTVVVSSQIAPNIIPNSGAEATEDLETLTIAGIPYGVSSGSSSSLYLHTINLSFAYGDFCYYGTIMIYNNSNTSISSLSSLASLMDTINTYTTERFVNGYLINSDTQCYNYIVPFINIYSTYIVVNYLLASSTTISSMSMSSGVVNDVITQIL